ncbi:hypothetical protein [Halioxenophilus sp. WMMB6]|uniref:hypothetical protein n=1 Tax=Halioxenophilus sp. WMMB6 TaxID=3073815 RepID=UPI00295F294D|nr:hypothetical protein [Halioxenophilus sp. WMMB6]
MASRAQSEMSEAVAANDEMVTEAVAEPEAASVAPGMAADSAAPSYRCELHGKVRRIEVSYLNPSALVPCEVNYLKEVEAPGQTQALWSAEQEVGYCEQKASDFVAKLKEWGWQCQ